jgi:flavodoxin
MIMNKRSVLSAYATRYGSTQEVVESITAVLRGAGFEVEIQPMREAVSALPRLCDSILKEDWALPSLPMELTLTGRGLGIC